MDKLTGYDSWIPKSKVWGSWDLPLFQEAEFLQGTVDRVTGTQHYHINYNHIYHCFNCNHLYHHIYININYNHLYHYINYNHLYPYINYTQHYHITSFMLERTIANMARVKEGTMGQGGTGEQTGEEDNIKTFWFSFQLVYHKEKGKEVTDNKGDEKKEGDEEKKDKDAHRHAERRRHPL